MPVAPGTAGAAEGAVIFLAVIAFHPERGLLLYLLIVLNVVLFVAGVWSAGRTCKIMGLDDPRAAVIDEISGQLIALTPLAFLETVSIPMVIIGFLLFRLFDIFKPYPIRKLEHLPGGFGVMCDDVLAGVYAAVLLWLGHLARLI